MPEDPRGVRYKVAEDERPGAVGMLETVRAAGRRELPPRYSTHHIVNLFDERLEPLLKPGIRILDVGSGGNPTIALRDRPDGVSYTGFDVDASELERAPEGSYDETIVAPAETPVPELENRFDLAVSWFAMEHVPDVGAAFDNLRTYLVPGGTLVAQFAGRWSAVSVANRMVPHKLARKLLWRAHRRESDSVFPAIYDRCTFRELTETLASWGTADVIPQFTVAEYVLFSRVLTSGYIAYEEAIERLGMRDLSPYYLVVASR